MVIDDVSNLGSGVGRVLLPDGSKWVIMVPNVIAGERVKVKVFRNYDSYSEAELVEVQSPSPDRVVAPCPFFSTRIGQLAVEDDDVNSVIGTDHHYGYRTKLTPHYDVPRVGKAVKIGFQMKGSRNIVDIDQCIIASSVINSKYAEERLRIAERIEADGGYVETDMRKTVTQTVMGLAFKVKAGEFFQNNPYVLPYMINHVCKQALGVGDCKYLIDTYCGSGLFALSSAGSFQSVYGVEVSELAIASAKENAQINNITNTQFLQGQSTAIFQTVSHLDASQTVVVIDPPRKGCDEEFLTQLFAFRPKRLVYVSCDPATQARDAKAIVTNGYKIIDITPFDLFPQTRHIENVITFTL
eukprot:gene30730-37130_t